MVTYEGLFEAYLDCRRRKSRTINCVKFTLDYETRLLDMVEAINDKTYRPTRSICFVVTRPKYREVFAADFADRIIHHWIRLRLEPLMELAFNDRTFNCRQGKGTLNGVYQLERDIKECSENYTKDCYAMRVDIQSFFMSISKQEIEKIVDDFIVERYKKDDVDDLRWLCHVVLSNHPEENCIKQSSEELWSMLPPNKSLFTNDYDCGMPIGNLPSQMFANFLLNDVDWMIDEITPYHGRYVDDIFAVHQDRQVLLDLVPKIRKALWNHGLKLSRDKFYIQHYSKGISFTGAIIKPGRKYPMNHTVDSFEASVLRLNKCKNLEQIEKALASVNSYLGLMIHYDSYAIRRNILSEIDSKLFKYIYIKGHFEVVSLKKKYTPLYRVKRDIKKKFYYKRISLPGPL